MYFCIDKKKLPMDKIVVYYQANRLVCTTAPTDVADVHTDCAAAFSVLESGHDVRLICSLRTLLSYCHARYTMVRAAGGVVRSTDGRWLLMRRESMWDLPKGMVEHGETLATAALREVQEETGVTAQLTSKTPCVKTYHIYNKYGGWHLKQTAWFSMIAEGTPLPVPQQEEGIEQVEWVDKETWVQSLQMSFASLRQVARRIEN